jgi:hypothetical protein
MPTPTLEVQYLEEAMLADSPPCQAWIVNYTTGQRIPCGYPSVARCYLECITHGKIGPEFLCDKCLAMVKAGQADCYYCNSPKDKVAYLGES